MSNFTFDPKTHTYRLDGKPVASITQVLRGVGIIHVSDFCTGPEFGSAVHKACALLDQGLDAELQAMDGLPELMPYLEAWQRFKNDAGIKHFAAIEEKAWTPTPFGPIAGTSDRVAFYKTIYDIKTGAWQWGYEVQLVAYRHIEGKHITELAGVQLNPSIKPGYKIHRVDKKKYLGYWNIFLKALEIYNAKLTEGRYL